MRILVVDCNRVFARQVCAVIKRYGRDIEVESADNVHVLIDRLKNAHYDLIIADVYTAINPDDLMETLEGIKTPKIVWSLSPDLEVLRDKLKTALRGTVVHKPVNAADLAEVMTPLMASVSGMRPCAD